MSQTAEAHAGGLDREKLDKLAKILALADDERGAAEERENARAMAQKMLAGTGISIDEARARIAAANRPAPAQHPRPARPAPQSTEAAREAAMAEMMRRHGLDRSMFGFGADFGPRPGHGEHSPRKGRFSHDPLHHDSIGLILRNKWMRAGLVADFLASPITQAWTSLEDLRDGHRPIRAAGMCAGSAALMLMAAAVGTTGLTTPALMLSGAWISAAVVATALNFVRDELRASRRDDTRRCDARITRKLHRMNELMDISAPRPQW